MEHTEEIMSPQTFQVVATVFGTIMTVLWFIVQFNVIRFIKRQDSFSSVKDDHERRLVSVETEMKQTIKTAERLESSLENIVNETRKDVKELRITIYEYLLKANHQPPH